MASDILSASGAGSTQTNCNYTDVFSSHFVVFLFALFSGFFFELHSISVTDTTIFRVLADIKIIISKYLG